MHDKAIQNFTEVVEAYCAASELRGRARSISPNDECASKLRAALKKHFGTYGSPWTLQGIVDVQFSRAVNEAIDIVPEGMPAKEVLPSDLIADTARSIAAWLGQLPRQYTFFIPMPRLWSSWRGVIRLCDQIGFCEFGINTSGRATPVDPDFAGSDFAVKGLFHDYDDGSVYLTVKVEGLFSGAPQLGAENLAVSKAKQFLFLSKLTSEHFDDDPDALPPVNTGFVTDDRVGTALAAPFALPGSMRSCLNVWARWPWHEDDNYERLSIEGLEEDLRNSYQALLPLIERPDDFQPVLSATEWAFDAWYEDNETNAFVFLAIAFEALLDSPGGEASIGVSLADRLAYSVARTLQERRDICATFKRFYQARSKLVHGKSSRIEGSDRELLCWGKDHFLRALRAEVAIATRASERGGLSGQ